jgi:Flp pilus assembly protein TadB
MSCPSSAPSDAAAPPKPTAAADVPPSDPLTPQGLTAAEQELLRRYQQLDATPRRSAQLLAVELLPPLALVALWVWSGHAVFLLALIAVQVVCNVLRVLRQRRSLRHLQRIARKTLQP